MSYNCYRWEATTAIGARACVIVCVAWFSHLIIDSLEILKSNNDDDGPNGTQWHMLMYSARVIVIKST